MADSKLASPNELCKQQLAMMCLVYNVCVQYATPWPYSDIRSWPYSDIRSCCRQYTHVFTCRYDSTLFGSAFLHRRCFWMRYHHFCKVNVISIGSYGHTCRLQWLHSWQKLIITVSNMSVPNFMDSVVILQGQ